MVGKKRWFILNISLVFIAAILLLTFFGVKLPTLGRALSAFDPQEPLCIVRVEGPEEIKYSAWGDLPRCCLEAQAQLECVREQQQFPEGETDFSCRTSAQVQYLLNDKAFSYCQQQAFWRK